MDLLEASFQRSVLLDVLPVFLTETSKMAPKNTPHDDAMRAGAAPRAGRTPPMRSEQHDTLCLEGATGTDYATSMNRLQKLWILAMVDLIKGCS